MTNINSGPIIALIMEMSNEWIQLLQSICEDCTQENDTEGYQTAHARLERISMLRALVQMSFTQQPQPVQQTETTITEKITSYLQEHDPEVFPIEITAANGKNILLDTHLGVSLATGNWLDALKDFNIMLTKEMRTDQKRSDAAFHENPSMLDVLFKGTLDIPPVPPTTDFPATRNPGFIPERLPIPTRPENVPSAPEHKREINPGMPQSGDQQGMPGGRIGDR